MPSLSRLALAAALLCGAAHADRRGDPEPQLLPNTPTLPILFAEGEASSPDAPSFVGRARGFLAAFHRDRIELVRDDAAKSARIALRFAGAATTPISEEVAPGKLHYLVGERSQWRQNVSLHAALRYRALWPGVDLVVHGRAGELQYDLHFAPGTSLDAVGFRIDGASEVRIDENGALVMRTPLGEMVQQAPLTWEVAADGRREVVPSRFALREDGSYGFAVQRLDASRPLVVDPVLVWGTYLGINNSNEIVYALDVDASGAVYVAGTCGGPFGYETPGAYRTSSTSGEGFLAKLDPSQTGAAQVVWLTYIGGSGGDSVRAMVRRPSGTLVVAGEEESGNGSGLNGLLTANAYATTGASFLAEISADGSSLLYGTRCDFVVRHLELEASGVLVMAGNATQNPLRFATTTPGSFQPVKNADGDIWLARFDMSSSGSAQLLWASYFGGTGYEEVTALVSSPTEPGVFTIAGLTGNAASLPSTHSSGQLSLNDVFVARFDTQQTGSAQLRFSHLYGRFSGPFGQHDAAGGIALQPDGSFWVSVASAYSQLLRFSSDGASLMETWTWYLAGAHGDLHRSDDGILTLVGRTIAIPSTPDAVQPSFGGFYDISVVQFDPIARQILYATHLGGASDESYEFGSSCMRGNVLTLGGSTRGGTPIYNAIQPTHAGGCCLMADAYLARLELPFGQSAAPGIGPRDLALLDLDDDGDLDVATANESSSNLSLRTNDGQGTLSSETTLELTASDTAPVALVRCDLDNDGDVDDLAVACEGSDTFVLLTNPGGASPTRVSRSIDGGRASSIACGDLDANPLDDIVIGREGLPLAGGSGIALSLNGGVASSLTIPAAQPTQVVAVALGDLDGDGDTDLAAVARGASDALLLFAGNGAGALVFAAALPLGTSGTASALVLTDLDRDGRSDLAVARPVLFPPSQSLRIYRRTSSGALAAGLFAAALDVATSGSFATDLAAGDLEQDSIAGHFGRVDLAQADAGSGTLVVRHGFTGSAFSSSTSPTVGSGPVAVAIGDLDGDGCDDLVVANQASSDVSVVLTTTPALAQSYGTGCGGPVLAGSGLPTLGNTSFGVHLSSARSFAPAIFFYGLSSANAPLPPSACSLLFADSLGSLLLFTSGSGESTLGFRVPNDPFLRGADLFFQGAVFRSPGGAFSGTLDLSNGLRVQVGS